LIIRPCAGLDPDLEKTLGSSALVTLSSAVRVRFAVATDRDEAFAAATRAAADARAAGQDARVVITGAVGPNRKADQVARVAAGEPGFDTLVVVDSDVELAVGDIDALLVALEEPNVAASWAPPVEVRPRTTADRASAAILDASLHSFTVLPRIDRGGLVGKLMAVRAEALSSIGGLSELAGYLGEDMELARRLGSVGYRALAVDVCARSTAGGRAWTDVLGRYARWIAVIRAQRPWLLPAYPIILAGTPVLVAACAATAVVDGPVFAGAAVVAGATRLAVAAVARRRTERPWTLVALAKEALLADALLLAAFVRALTTRQVAWRGKQLIVRADGRLAEIPSEIPPRGRAPIPNR
jgi:ceramide glucosyltransferase